jgi:four helix bundle protein
MSNTYFGFEQLTVWKKAKEFRNRIRELTKMFPTDEKYSLTDQVTRSSRSVLALISEGHGRFTYADQLHFCIQARGSLTETVNHMIEACSENYINEECLEEIKQQAKEIEKLLNGYINYLRKQKAAKN